MFEIFAKDSTSTDNEWLSKAIKRTLSKIIPLLFLALLFAALICSVANDMYAFVKKDREISLTVDSRTSLNDLSKILAENGVVNNPDLFELYVKLKHKETLVEEFCGDVKLNSSMSYREILSEIS